MSVRAGSGRAGSGGELLGVQAVVVHPAFSANLPGNALVNDLAVLKLAAPTSAPPVALASDAEDAALSAPGAPLISAGFGRRNPSALGRPRQGVLRAVRLRSRKACAHYPAFSAVTMLCASGSRFAAPIPGRGLKPVARSGCFGDSGGPLIAATPAGPRLLGVLSYGPVYPDRFETVACGLKGFPDVYTRVASGRAFIEANS
jgi:secreted trypsin-like serine protease